MHIDNHSKIFYLQKNYDLILFFYNKITAIYSYSLKEYLNERIKNIEIKNIWIDLANCTYMDSTTIGAVLQLHNRLERNNGKLILCNLHEKINKIFLNAHLNSYLNIEINNNISNMEKQFFEVMPLREKIELSDEFILDTHHDLVKIVPELRDQFESLFNLLKEKINNE